MSFGVQSTEPTCSLGLGRRHGRRGRDAVPLRWPTPASPPGTSTSSSARRPRRDDDWARTLDDVLALEPAAARERLRPHRRAGHAAGRATRGATPTKTRGRRYELADEVLDAAGYRWEEISNWAQPGHECRHNHLYWDQGDYVGFGSAAHSHRARPCAGGTCARPSATSTPSRPGASAVAAARSSTADQRALRALVLALRTPRGVPWSRLDSPEEIADLVDVADGRVVLDGPRPPPGQPGHAG